MFMETTVLQNWRLFSGSMYHRVGEEAPWASLATAAGAAGGSSSSPTALHWASADGMYPQKKCHHTFG